MEPKYKIRKVRLVNFHNFQNETVDIEGGGHLFLLGDNGSGKTTILDAVHYVLTAGQHMEFNSAARVGARKDGGRRPQGIVMRYNVETGPMNTTGGVSYAAVELYEEDSDRVLTLGVGLSTFSMDERIQRWGILKAAPIDSIPWTTEENGAMRVTTQREMREALGTSGGFLNIGAYAKEIARRLFTSDEIFRETCRFLSMGKAYREIASSAADYHELFKTLLPEPKTDLFDRIIEALRGLEEAGALLDEMKRKLTYLDGLDALVKTVDDLRESTARYRWMLLHFRKVDLESETERIEQDLKKTQQTIARLADERAALQDRLAVVQRTIEDLRSKDSAGLVRQRNELAQDLERATQKYESLERDLGEATSALQASEKRTAESLRAVTGAVKRIETLCDPIGTVAEADTSSMAELVRAQTARESPSPTESSVVVDELREILDTARTSCTRDLDKYTVEAERTVGDIERIRARRRELESAGDVRPEIPGLSEALSVLDEENIDAHLLYELIEWRADVAEEIRSYIEEAVGKDVLSTICVTQPEHAETLAIVTRTAPGIRVGDLSTVVDELPDWITASLDIGKSKPGALAVLAEEMHTRKGPSRSEGEFGSILTFRAHQRRLSGAPSRFIGLEERRRALESALALLDAQADELEREHASFRKRADEARRRLNKMERLASDLRTAGRELTETGNELALCRQEQKYRTEQRDGIEGRLREADEQRKGLASRLKAVDERVRQEGLEELESRIEELDSQRREIQEEYDALLRREGATQEHNEALRRRSEEVEERLTALSDEFDRAEEDIRNRIAESIEDISYYVLRTRQGVQFKNAEAVESAIRDADRRDATAVGSLREKLTDPVYGATFGFHYDENNNRLVDRRDSPVSDLAEAQRASITEQEQVINERTAELFKKIIVTELVSFFARHVSRLERMVRTINERLSRRTFGSTRYKLELVREDRYRPLIEAVKKFNPFDAQTEEVLRNFIEDHRDEILSTEMETVPEALDYRNWYSYHLRMGSADDEGVLIDRRTKSVGSGGEQAVPNYLTILTIAHFLFEGNALRVHTLLFDEAFYGIDAGRRDQLLGFAGDMGLQLLVASPEQDGAKREVERSTTMLIVKDSEYNVHLYPFHWENRSQKQMDLFAEPDEDEDEIGFEEELGA